MAVLWWIMVKFFSKFLPLLTPSSHINTVLCSKVVLYIILSLGTVLWLSIKSSAQSVSQQDKGDEEGRKIKTLLWPAFSALSLRGITHAVLTAKPLIQQVIFHQVNGEGRGRGAFKSKNKPLCCTAKYLLFKQKRSAFSIFDVRLNSTWTELSLKLSGTKSCVGSVIKKAKHASLTTVCTAFCLALLISSAAFPSANTAGLLTLIIAEHAGCLSRSDTDEIHLNTSILMK